jgi:hypothetical protein
MLIDKSTYALVEGHRAFPLLARRKSCEECPVWGANLGKAAGTNPAAFSLCEAVFVEQIKSSPTQYIFSYVGSHHPIFE